MSNNNYCQRVIEPELREALKVFPVVGITGPRQSGKTTLLMEQLQDYTYVTFDDPLNVDYFTQDPKGFISQYNQKIIFDEIQYVPELFNYIKIAVDKDRKQYGRFVVTGSSQFAFMKGVSESLAGRIALLSLLPLQYLEIPKKQQTKVIYKGSYPELVLKDYKGDRLWYSTYLDTYLTRDVRALANIGDIRDFQRLIRLLAANTGQLLDYSSYANNLGVAVSTIKRWISILEASYIIFLLPPFYENFGKRITKSPKIYFYDTGLVSYLTGIETFKLYNQGPLAGALFENYIIADIYKNTLHQTKNEQLYFLRTSSKQEIDLIVDKHTHREFIEIKKSKTFKMSYIQIIKEFMQKGDFGIVLYQGEALKISDNIEAKPYYLYFNQQTN